MSDIQTRIVSKPILGISECLLGKEVRYNGGHKKSRYCTDVLSEYFDFQAICPEVLIGLPVPRKAIRIVDVAGKNQVIATDNPSVDYMQDLTDLASKMAPSLSTLCGYIFMQQSPSCGVGSAKIYNDRGHPSTKANGAFSDKLISALPLLPVTEAGRLNDAGIRENFIAGVYAYAQWQQDISVNLSAQKLIDFHYRHKLKLFAHDELAAKELGLLLADLKGKDLSEVAGRYISVFMQAIKKPITRKRHANILVKLQRFLKNYLSVPEKNELNVLFSHYRNGVVPLIVPMTVLRFLMRKYEQLDALSMSHIYPMELGLENRI
ncbi:MAG: hypothetical protein ACI9T7_003618 [Oleiphilaceae bacterium]|jgi:uncharacterized protein YbgA (DUF1722 family)/uncharacterized protein YbbK (DUF523 family)